MMKMKRTVMQEIKFQQELEESMKSVMACDEEDEFEEDEFDFCERMLMARLPHNMIIEKCKANFPNSKYDPVDVLSHVIQSWGC